MAASIAVRAGRRSERAADPGGEHFQVPETSRVTMLAAAPARQAASATHETEERSRHAAASRPATRSRHAAHQAPHNGHGAPKHAAQVKKNGRAVRVASLKKR